MGRKKRNRVTCSPLKAEHVFNGVKSGLYKEATDFLSQNGCETQLYDPELRECSQCQAWNICAQLGISKLMRAEPSLRERHFPGTGKYTITEEWDRIVNQRLASPEKIREQNFKWDAPDIEERLQEYLHTHDPEIINEIISRHAE